MKDHNKLINKLLRISEDMRWELLMEAAMAIRELQQDAARYQWLRRNTDWFDWDIVVVPWLPDEHEAHDDFSIKLDCALNLVMGVPPYQPAIDAAMKGTE